MEKTKYFESTKLDDLVPITFSAFIPKDKIRKTASENMSILQNDVRSTSRYVKILIDSVTSALIIHDSFVQKNNLYNRKTSVNKWSAMAGLFSTSYKAKHPQ